MWGGDQRRAVVMFGVPSGVVFDSNPRDRSRRLAARNAGHVIAAARRCRGAPALPPKAPTSVGRVESILGSRPRLEPRRFRSVRSRAIAGHGLEGDRHVTGNGTFPSGFPGSALTLIEAEVCESFTPPLAAARAPRNLVTQRHRS